MAKGKYDETLNLPQTGFPMRANLPQREPEILKFWDEIDIYRRIQEKNTGRPQFILHDGPPYANGDIHLGHTLNKVLKDIIVKYRSMGGYDSISRAGMFYGLPIEQQAIRTVLTGIRLMWSSANTAAIMPLNVEIQKNNLNGWGWRWEELHYPVRL